MAVAPAHHRAQNRLRTQEGALQIHVDHPVPVLFAVIQGGHLFHPTGDLAHTPSIIEAVTAPAKWTAASWASSSFPAKGMAMRSASAPAESSPMLPLMPRARAPFAVAISRSLS